MRAPARLAAVAAAYYLSALLGLQLAAVGRIVTPLWPPTGVAVVAIWILGYDAWPAIAIAAFAVNLPLAASPATAALIAVGNTVAPLAAVAMLRRLGFDQRLARLRDALDLVFVALIAMTVSASIGTLAVKLSGAPIRVPETWWVWWAGDAMGVLIVAPVLWCGLRVRRDRFDWGRAPEAAALFVALAAAAYSMPRIGGGVLFVVLPPLAWIAWRFRQAGAAPAGLVVSTFVILAAVDDVGRFHGVGLVDRMVLLQSFNACVALTSFVFAAAVTERQEMLEELYAREHGIAVALQRSFLPPVLPDIPGVAVGAQYRPARRETEVGGDWYDVMAFRDDVVGIVVGDVAGHGIPSAATMAQLRTGLRAHAHSRGSPAGIVASLNELAADLHPGTLATLTYVELVPTTSRLHIVNAGHPPPLLISPDGDARFLDLPAAVPLGVTRDFDAVESVHELPEGSTLLLYTDGLVERRDADLGQGMDALREEASAAVRDGADPQELCDRLVTRLAAPTAPDDVAVLAVRPVSLRGETLHLERPALPTTVTEVRQLLRRWLRAQGVEGQDLDDLLLASTEAQTNAVRHAYRSADGIVTVDASCADGGVLIVVRDQGRWRRDEGPDADGERGRGLALIRRLADATVHTEPHGTEIRLTRRIERSEAGPLG